MGNGPGKERAVQNVSPGICTAERDGLVPVIVCNASLYNKVGALGNEHKPRWLRFKHCFRALRVGFGAGPVDYAFEFFQFEHVIRATF